MILSKHILKSIDLDEIKKNIILKKELSSLLLIVPTKRKIRDLEKELIRSSPNRTTGKLNIHTIETVSAEILMETNSKFRLSDDAVSMVLLNQCYSELKDFLEYFPKDELPSGTLHRLKNVISEYKRTGITPELLEEETETRELTHGEVLKIKDIVKLYRSFNQKCEEYGIKEIGDIYAGLNAMPSVEFQKAFRKAYPDASVIIIEGYDNFSPSEISIIDRLGDIPGCNTYIDFDYSGKNPSVFNHLETIYDNFKLLQWSIIPFSGTNNSKAHEFKETLSGNLGLNKNKTQKYESNDRIFRIEASTRINETEKIGKEIKELICPSDNKSVPVAPHEICVVFNKIDRYASVVRDVFTSYNIPYNLTDRKVLANSLPVLAALNFLQIKENDFFYKDIMRAFSSGYFFIKDFNYPVLMKVATGLKIVSGYNNWMSRIKETLALMEIENKEDEDALWFLNNISKDNLEEARESLSKLHKELEPFSRPMAPAEFKKELDDLLRRFGFQNKVTGEKKRKNASTESLASLDYYRFEENTRGYQKFLETVEDLLQLIESSGKDKEYDLSFYLSQLRTAFKRTRFNVLEKYNYGVLVTTPDEIRGLKFKHLFIGGLIDGEWPTAYSPEIFFTETFSRKDEQHQTEERYRFYQTLSSWTDRLYLSYPKHEDTREFEKSIFLKEFENIVSTEEINSEKYAGTIYSLQELLQRAGKDLGTDVTGVFDGITQEDIHNAVAVDNLRAANLYTGTLFTGSINGANENNTLISNISGKSLHLLDDNSKEKLTSLKDKTFSASQLETYAKCPYKYFTEKVLRLKVIEEPSEDVESNEMGTMLHRIFCQFYREVTDNKIAVNIQNKDMLLEKLLSIAREMIKDRLTSPISFYEKEKILGIAGNHEDSILYRFLMTEIESQGDGFVPAYFEVSFGEEGESYELEGVKLRGQIDRIDINKDLKQFKIIDYKLGGKAPTKPQLENGLSLQLPLYLHAAQTIINKNGDNYTPHSAIIYSLKYSADDFKKNVVIQETSKKIPPLMAMEISAKKIPQYIKSISGGVFSLNDKRDKETCKYCDFSNICRLEGELN
ncbi:MAG: PD-(D/E)XK nuclease family protein [Acidobacteriota bacterium]